MFEIQLIIMEIYFILRLFIIKVFITGYFYFILTEKCMF